MSILEQVRRPRRLRRRLRPRPVGQIEVLPAPARERLVSRPVTEIEQLQIDVGNAAAVLDEHVPGWPKRVTRPLDMASLDNCLLGQVFGGDSDADGAHDDSGYGRGLRFLRCEVGFEHGPGVFSTYWSGKFWLDEIERRGGR